MWVSCGKVLVKVVKIMVVAFMVILSIKFMVRFAMNVKGINEHHSRTTRTCVYESLKPLRLGKYQLT